MRAAAILAVVLVAAAPAGAGEMWADDARDDAAVAEGYAAAIEEGDKAAILAASGASNPATRKKLALRAVRAYERAAAADETAAEPHWRAANVLFGFFVDCEPNVLNPLCVGYGDPRILRSVVAHWHAFEDKAPLDPRITDLLFARAIIRTHLATDDDLRAAIEDYEKILDRTGRQSLELYTILGNLAESYMMLGDLDHAIERYREAIHVKQDTAVTYGLAVAYDRDGQGGKARELMRALGDDAFGDWELDVARGRTFYVPEGEVYYYLALAHEALGRPDDARRAWRLYLTSGAQPEYQPRARENLRALEKTR